MSEFATAADGTAIAYETLGEGAPVVLVHGFGASRAITWASTNWYQTLSRAGRRLVAIDCRGHGQSGRPRDHSYWPESLSGDVIAICEAAGVTRPVLVGPRQAR